MSGPLLIRGGWVIDPSQAIDATRDVLVVDGVVAEVREGIDPPEGAREIDAVGLVVTPGLIDVHVHLREPGANTRRRSPPVRGRRRRADSRPCAPCRTRTRSWTTRRAWASFLLRVRPQGQRASTRWAPSRWGRTASSSRPSAKCLRPERWALPTTGTLSWTRGSCAERWITPRRSSFRSRITRRIWGSRVLVS